MPSAQGNSNGASHLKSEPTRLYSVDKTPSLKVFKALCEQSTPHGDYPLAGDVEKNIPIYRLSPELTSDSQHVSQLQEEWYRNFHTGPGVVVLKDFFPYTSTIKTVNSIFDKIIESEASNARGDHFATSGKNSRIWNSFQKHAEADPTSFLEYYSNPWLSHICEAWLGPGYQVTAQVNIVRPGGSPQVCHRDYHLGFQSAESCARYPKAMQVASQFLTLQGAIAHSEVPLESGPTRFLPFSQQFEEGFMAYRLPEFQEYFNGHWVSLAMKPGDAVFFNPALFHAAGQNDTDDVHRSANLLQISSAFGKAMETVDTARIIELCWADLSKTYQKEGLSQEVKAFVSAIASGYPFPTNLDRRPPAPGGMAPGSEADVVYECLRERWTKPQAVEALHKYRRDSSA